MKISEIFTSIQGEGPFVGYKQLFIRFCGCNLNCGYCDTDFKNGKEYSEEKLIEICEQSKDCHSVSLTGGEPLLHTEFLKSFLPKISLPVYLETNATLYENLQEIINNITYVSADIKLPSCTGLKSMFELHDKFFNIAEKKHLFAKIVFNENITEKEIVQCCELGNKHKTELILQPVMNGDKLGIDTNIIPIVHNKFLSYYKNVRVIPQTHKFICCK